MTRRDHKRKKNGHPPLQSTWQQRQHQPSAVGANKGCPMVSGRTMQGRVDESESWRADGSESWLNGCSIGRGRLSSCQVVKCTAVLNQHPTETSKKHSVPCRNRHTSAQQLTWRQIGGRGHLSFPRVARLALVLKAPERQKTARDSISTNIRVLASVMMECREMAAGVREDTTYKTGETGLTPFAVRR